MQVRLCPEHAQQLNFRKNREALEAQAKAARKQKHKRGSDPEGVRRSRSIEEPEGTSGEAHIGGKKRRREGDVEPGSAGEVKGRDTKAGEDALRQEGEKEESAAEGDGDAVNVWKGKQPQLEASKDEEFDEYFSGMFL